VLHPLQVPFSRGDTRRGIGLRCNVETIIGQLYPATLLARLVTLELAHRR
jgi:hypothetical protein